MEPDNGHQRELADRVAIVTGGARGIGRATARGLAAAGANVVILDLVAEEAAQVAANLRGMAVEVDHHGIDLGNIDQIPGVVTTIREKFGRIDILVNCAAIEGGPDTILDLPLDTWERVHPIDLTAPFLLMQHCARAMIDGGRSGRIVNVTSSSAFRAALTQLDYASAKAGLVGLSRSVAAQLAPYDINVNCVAPGLTVTTMSEQLEPAALQQMVEQGPLENLFHRLSQPEDAATSIVFLCLPGSRQITAQTIHTSAGSVT